MRISLPTFGATYVADQMRELVRLLETAFLSVKEDNRRGAITVTADYELQKQDSLVLVAPVASATVVITVPTVAQWMIDQKWEWSTKLIAAGTMTLAPVSGTIDGAASNSTSVVQTAKTMRATDDGWKLI